MIAYQDITLYSLATAEALGLREGLSWLKGLQIQNMTVEFDAQDVLEAINNSVSDKRSGIRRLIP